MVEAVAPAWLEACVLACVAWAARAKRTRTAYLGRRRVWLWLFVFGVNKLGRGGGGGVACPVVKWHCGCRCRS